jgi:hypothetical protein
MNSQGDTKGHGTHVNKVVARELRLGCRCLHTHVSIEMRKAGVEWSTRARKTV